MKKKRNKEYFDDLKDCSFAEFMDQLNEANAELRSLLEKSHFSVKNGTRFSCHLHLKIRRATILMGKFFSQFRVRTIQMEKEKNDGFNEI